MIIKPKGLGGGLYITADKDYFERPWIQGKRVWRKIDAPSAKAARTILGSRRADAAKAAEGLGRDPYAPQGVLVGDLLDKFVAAGCPTRKHGPKVGKALRNEESRIKVLRKFWGLRAADRIVPSDCAGYRTTRKGKKNTDGGAAVDRELSTLKSVLRWAVIKGHIASNPLNAPLEKFRVREIRHSREVAPADAGEIHIMAAHFFMVYVTDQKRWCATKLQDMRVLGWQTLLGSMTGCRTSELLRLRWDAGPRQPGYIEGEWLWLQRSKRGVNPFALIHPALRACLNALRSWCQEYFPDNPYFLPSPWCKGKPISPDGLTHELQPASESLLGHRITPHGLRSYYVTARRSQGISDSQIAAEIGDKTGASIISSTYGDIPPGWAGSTKKLGWLPDAPVPPAWEEVFGEPAQNVINLTPKSGNPGGNLFTSVSL
jgi:integrase